MPLKQPPRRKTCLNPRPPSPPPRPAPTTSPDAYTRLVLEVLRGKQATFVRSDELLEAWKIFTPVLKQIEAGEIPPIPYKFGTRGPKESDDLVEKMGYEYNKNYDWAEAHESSK